MRCQIRCFAFVFGLFAAVTAPAATTTDSDDIASQYKAEGYELVWHDEFNKPGQPDPANWTYETGFVRNNEAQFYQPSNAFVDDGLLVIEARRETVDNPAHDPSSNNWRQQRKQSEYTSASVTTRGLHDWTFGRFEMRGRIDIRPGLWPAWWTVGSNQPWPSSGEIDMMEYYRGMLLANACWKADDDRRWSAKWDATRHPIEDFKPDPDQPGDTWTEQFHTWRMDWDEEQIVLSVDGNVLNTIDLTETINPDGSNPFHRPHYMIANVAIGGDNGGDPSHTDFPARYEIDWIRVYQKPEHQIQPSADADNETSDTHEDQQHDD
ncbi:MAG: glycoside hydrolase family 16 protein [Planctomycetota bacterium]